jgi:hypothetical protein
MIGPVTRRESSNFHHGWIEEIARALNKGVLPVDYYTMAEQHAAGFGPNVLTLQERGNGETDTPPRDCQTAAHTYSSLRQKSN